MTPLRQFFDRLLLAGALFMAVVSLIIIVSTIRTVRDTSQNLQGNLAFDTTQLEYETAQLLDRIERYGEADPDISLDDVLIRFDILWSRIFINISKGTDTVDAVVQAEISGVIDSGRAMLKDIEPDVANLQPGDRDTIADIKTKLRNFLPMAHRLTLVAKDFSALTETIYLRSQLRQAYLTFGLIIGMALFGVLSILMLRTTQREIRTMNVQLEDRVRKRTQDLQTANSRLAAEIVERKRNQDLAADREARQEQAVQLAKLGYYVWDAVEDKCEFCSDQHAAAHGVTPTEYIDRASKLGGSFGLTHPEDREKVCQKYRELRAGNIVEMGYRVVTPSGVRRLREVARPIFDDAGHVIREIGSSLDVTDQYETEMKLHEAQRMDSIGKMTGGVAHDFNNLLAVILGNLELMREVPESDEREEMIDDAIKATLRGRDLTMSMLSFARRAPLDPSELNLNTVIADLEGMLRRTLPENISVEVALGDDIWTVLADRSLTESAILNLAINARDAMPGGGKLTFETANMTLGTEYLHDSGEAIEPGNYVMMAVTDSGKGIKAELLDHIFEPFFTTKAITKNSGLGLSMVHGFIRQTGGAIRVYSEIDTGTTFKLFFQATEAAAEVAQTTLPMSPGRLDRALRVLLVEDDETVRKVLTRQLEQAGMTVIAASESASAERAFKTEGAFDIVVSDVVMPGDLQGPALVRRLREFDPGLPAVFLSGYPQEATVHGNGVKSDDVMLMKPVGRDDLTAAIDAAIGPMGNADRGD